MIPAAVNQVVEKYQNLDNADIEGLGQPELVKRDGIAESNIIKMVFMRDDLGRAQVLFPANCLLDVEMLNRVSGRSLRAMCVDEVVDISQVHRLTQLPAIPDITGLPTIIDPSILALDEVYVETEHRGQLIKLSKEFFHVAVRNAQQMLFAQPLEDIEIVDTSESQDDLFQISQAIEKFTTRRIKDRLQDTLELPPLPQSANDIIRLRSNPDAGVSDLADIIERDPALAAQVVSWASSSFYNAPGKVRSVHDAIGRVLGFDMVMNLAMGLALGRVFELPEEQPESYLPYWHRAILTALANTSVAQAIDADERPEMGLSYLSGLLHNIGFVVLAHVFPPHFKLICRYIEANPHVSSSMIEHHVLGITSEQMGGLLMELWQMPEEIVQSLRHQANPAFSGSAEAHAKLLCLTNQLLAKYASLHNGREPVVDESLLEHFSVDQDDMADVIHSIIDNQEDLDMMAGMLG